MIGIFMHIKLNEKKSGGFIDDEEEEKEEEAGTLGRLIKYFSTFKCNK